MNKIFIFVAGAAVGSLVTWKIVEQKYKQLANEEVASVVETFKNRLVEKEEKERKDEHPDWPKPIETETPPVQINVDELKDVTEYNNIVKDSNYNVEENTNENEDNDSDYLVNVQTGPASSTPYVITEDEFGEFGNEEKTLIFYDDGILADEEDDIITDPESVVGDALDDFSDAIIERVYVRDENNEIDYIILRSEKTYKEIYGEEEE